MSAGFLDGDRSPGFRVSGVAIEQGVLLAPFTTLGLGGEAAYVARCSTLSELREALAFARKRSLKTHILGGGSNVVFSDRGFNGLVLKVELKGREERRVPNGVEMSVAAGEPWDEFVESCVSRNLGGIECLSGIPGLVGATPIQNVGAYGQEVEETVTSVQALSVDSLEIVEFTARECGFGYRDSRFKAGDAGKFIVTQVRFLLGEGTPPAIRYPELQKSMHGRDSPSLRVVREAVIALRRGKSMVIDPTDPHSKSVGSFFTNPVLSKQEYGDLEKRVDAEYPGLRVPTFPSNGSVKVPAAWFVEQSGFRKGFRRGSVGVSDHHALALVNYGGTSAQLLELADDIQRTVYEKFGIRLEREPVVVPF
jgi:UDP-N-acetylmuramate dehydrogenase